VGKPERQTWTQEKHGCLQEVHRSQADESSYAEETVGVDEGTMGREEEGGVGSRWHITVLSPTMPFPETHSA